MNKSVFEFSDYKMFLTRTIDSPAGGGRGVRSQMAKAAGCQLPYVSHVLNGDSHFSPEQLEGIGEFLGLSDEEKDFLLVLLQISRAGTPSLRSFYARKMKSLSEKYISIKSRIKPKASIQSLDQMTYYSHWSYAAVHMLSTIPEFQSVQPIAHRLGLSLAKVRSIVDFLETRKLVKFQNGKITPLEMDLHLGEESAAIVHHHTNWRLKAIESLGERDPNEIHYSLVFTASRQDLKKLRSLLLSAIKDCADIIRPSSEEEIACFNLDFFGLK